MSQTFIYIIWAMSIGRVMLGIAPFFFAKASSRLLGFPEAHDTPTTRLMARFFGVRDIGLGVLAYYATQHQETASFLFLFNALMDAGDLTAISIPLIKKQGIDRAAWMSFSFAFIGGISWLIAWTQLG